MDDKKEYVLSKQLLKSGTSIGANIEEAQQARSKKDFISKISIASQEAYESRYWLRLIRDSKYAEPEQVKKFLSDIDEVIRLLVAILKSTKDNS